MGVPCPRFPARFEFVRAPCPKLLVRAGWGDIRAIVFDVGEADVVFLTEIPSGERDKSRPAPRKRCRFA